MSADSTLWVPRSHWSVAALLAIFFTLSPHAVAQTFNQIQLVIATGDDDLRSDSSATATLQAANGTMIQLVTLKAQNAPAWANNTVHTVVAHLNQPQTASSIARIVITLTSHNSAFEQDDNWNVQSVTATLSNNGAGAAEVINSSGTPLVRLTKSQPSVALAVQASGPPGTFNQIQFVITTGGDDLRGNSEATATLQSANYSPVEVLTLKAQNDPSWSNNTTHTIVRPLNPPRTPCAIGHTIITLTSHNGLGETNDNWNVQSVAVTLTNNGAGPKSLVRESGIPLARLTGEQPSLVLDSLGCLANALGPQPGTGRLKGFVDLHTHPLANVGFGGKLLYGGVDVGALLPADPDCGLKVRAINMYQALGHDESTHGPPGPSGQNICGDLLRYFVIDSLQKKIPGAAQESSDAKGAPDFREWPVWNDITHQKMWVEWIRRAYLGGLRVMVALAVNNKTLADATAGPGDFATDDKTSADLQIAEIKSFVGRHADFMEIALGSADLERIVRANKLAVVVGVEIDNIGNFNKVNPLTDQEISAEIARLFNEGVRYIFPIHVIDNPFGGTAVYDDVFNYSNFRETGHWWALACADNSINYAFKAQGFDLFTQAGEAAKLGVNFAIAPAPPYPQCAQRNQRGLTAQGTFAIKEMMRRGMLIDIDHMSDQSLTGAIAIAQGVANGPNVGYPLNSGHSGLRGFFPQGVARTSNDSTERSMTKANYAKIAKLHGMAGVGSATLTSHQWVEMYDQVVAAMGGSASAGFGTDTDGFALGMPPRPGASVRYDDSFPISSLGTKRWSYNTSGVVHYGMLADFVKDARTAPGGAGTIDNNLMFGADYLLQTWKKCEALSESVK